MLLGSLAVPLLPASDHAKPAAHPPPAKPTPKPEAKPSALGEHKEPPKPPPPPPKPAPKAPIRHATRAQRPKPATAAPKPASAEPHDKPVPEYPVPGNILPDLVAGNRRFASGHLTHPRQNAARIAQTAATGEHPRACVLTCTDSRIAPELIFDQGIGDLHTLRLAGHIASPDAIASLELILEETNTPVCIVLGHTGCSAVSSIVEERRLSPSAATMLKPVANAVARTRRYNPSLKGHVLSDECVRVNVWQSVEDLLRGSEMIATRVRTGILRIAGAVYHTDTGVVEWLGSYPGQLSILR